MGKFGKKVKKVAWAAIPSVVMLGVGVYILGSGQVVTIAGWLLAVFGLIGALGVTVSLFK